MPTNVEKLDEESNISKEMDKMKIAWRYEGLSQVESSFGVNTNLGHQFDLSKYIDSDTINNCNITYFTPNTEQEANTGLSHFYVKCIFYTYLFIDIYFIAFF